MPKKSAAYTLLELLVVIGILVTISVLTVSISLPQIQGSKTEGSIKEIESLVFLQQQYAYAGRNDTSYGVKFWSNSYALFSGESYEGSPEVETVTLPGDVTISGISLGSGGDELFFQKGGFRPNTDAQITVTDGTNQYIFNITTEGVIYYSKN